MEKIFLKVIETQIYIKKEECPKKDNLLSLIGLKDNFFK